MGVVSNLFRKRFQNSIKSRLTFYFAVFSIVPLIIVSIYLYYEASDIVQLQAKKYAETVLSQTTTNINQLMDNVTNASVKLVTNPDIQNDDLPNLSEFDRNVHKRTIEKFMTNVMMSQPEISSMYLCMNNAGVISPNPTTIATVTECQQYRSYQLAINNNLMPLWMGMHENEYDEGTVSKNRYVMTLARTVYSFDSYEPLGVLIINISDETINNIFQNSFDGEPGAFYVTDAHKNLIYTQDPARYGTPLNEPYLDRVLQLDTKGGFTWKGDQGLKYIRYVYSTKSDWIFVAELPIDYIKRNSNVILKAMTVVVSICLILALIIAYILARKFTSPIKNLISSMRRVKEGNFNKTIELKRFDEIGILSQNYNSMIHEVRELLVRLDKENMMKRQAELDTLQAQITPHFLYNSLNSIKSLSRFHNNELIYKTTTSLIGLLQLSISKKTVFITIAEEIQMVKHYMELQNIRYQNKIKVLFEVDNELEECLTVKLILQPLVENSINHGLNLKEKSGIIVVRVYRSGNDVCLQVEDNGKGMEHANIRGLLLDKSSDESRRFSGIALKNVDERIKMHYGDSYGISFESIPGVNFVNTVRISYQKPESESNAREA